MYSGVGSGPVHPSKPLGLPNSFFAWNMAYRASLESLFDKELIFLHTEWIGGVAIFIMKEVPFPIKIDKKIFVLSSMLNIIIIMESVNHLPLEPSQSPIDGRTTELEWNMECGLL